MEIFAELFKQERKHLNRCEKGKALKVSIFQLSMEYLAWSVNRKIQLMGLINIHTSNHDIQQFSSIKSRILLSARHLEFHK